MHIFLVIKRLIGSPSAVIVFTRYWNFLIKLHLDSTRAKELKSVEIASKRRQQASSISSNNIIIKYSSIRHMCSIMSKRYCISIFFIFLLFLVYRIYAISNKNLFKIDFDLHLITFEAKNSARNSLCASLGFQFEVSQQKHTTKEQQGKKLLMFYLNEMRNDIFLRCYFI